MVAWGSGDTFAYHGANRYIGRIDFFNANQGRNFDTTFHASHAHQLTLASGNEYEAVLTELQRADTGLATWNITNDDYEIPEKRTTYRNVCFKIPEDMYTSPLLSYPSSYSHPSLRSLTVLSPRWTSFIQVRREYPGHPPPGNQRVRSPLYSGDVPGER